MEMLAIVLLIVVVIIGCLLWRWLMRACERANATDWGNKWVNRLDGLNRLFCHKFHRLRYDPLPLPPNGSALVVANHVSGLDPLLMTAASTRPLRFIIAREEYDRWWLRWLFKAIGCIPVERGANPRAALNGARRALSNGEVVALFPHGRIYLDDQPAPELKRGVVHLTKITGAPIYPLRIEGVRGQGLTVIAVFLRSRALLRCFAPLTLQDKSADELLRELGGVLSGDKPLNN